MGPKPKVCEWIHLAVRKQNLAFWHAVEEPGPLARSDARLPGIQKVAGLIFQSGKTFYWSWIHSYGPSLSTTDSRRQKDVHQVLVNPLGLGLPRKSVVLLTDCLDMTILLTGMLNHQTNKQIQSEGLEHVRDQVIKSWHLQPLQAKVASCIGWGNISCNENHGR